MKNLLIFISPDNKFDREHEDLTKIQIDNSLELGWNLQDIILLTNFPYEYRGIKSYVIRDGGYNYKDGNRSSKIKAILWLFRNKLIKEGEVYWFHDHDAFQLGTLEAPTMADIAMTNHCWSPIWNAGSFFFKKEAEDIFELILKYMFERDMTEQEAYTYILGNDIDQVSDRNTILNITYNLGLYHYASCLKKADKPVLVAHFHPHKSKHLRQFREILPERLLKLFNKYGIN